MLSTPSSPAARPNASHFGGVMLHSGARRVAALVAAFLVVSCPAGAQVFGKNKVQYEPLDWSVLETPHLRLHYYAEEESLSRSLAAFCLRVRACSTCAVAAARSCSTSRWMARKASWLSLMRVCSRSSSRAARCWFS